MPQALKEYEKKHAKPVIVLPSQNGKEFLDSIRDDLIK